MKPYTRLFALGTLYFMMEVLFLVAATLFKPKDMSQSQYSDVYMCLAFIGAALAAYLAYNYYTAAVTERHKALQS